ncbi:hypothetical protein B296_00001657 [Ensete ventricosum]|uniref:Uncharacterized protein n=1 Tax=Ensete ventricosum TaxID=4639 RepID=A0A427AQ58_ENSVE|nr:hypothetical protein B296_00001657 [Ensete ventricosum]
MTSRVCRKKTKRLTGRSSGVVEKLTGSGGCTAQVSSCIATTQESRQQATVGSPRPTIVLPIPYFQGGFRRLYRSYPDFLNTFEFWLQILKPIVVYKYFKFS